MIALLQIFSWFWQWNNLHFRRRGLEILWRLVASHVPRRLTAAALGSNSNYILLTIVLHCTDCTDWVMTNSIKLKLILVRNVRWDSSAVRKCKNANNNLLYDKYFVTFTWGVIYNFTTRLWPGPTADEKVNYRRRSWDCISPPSKFSKTPRFGKNFGCHIRTVPGYTCVKFEVHSFNRFGAISSYRPKI